MSHAVLIFMAGGHPTLAQHYMYNRNLRSAASHRIYQQAFSGSNSQDACLWESRAQYSRMPQRVPKHLCVGLIGRAFDQRLFNKEDSISGMFNVGSHLNPDEL